jgi:acyl-CoA reductase-like NAD-dependent aldehyde dehydrogenase
MREKFEVRVKEEQEKLAKMTEEERKEYLERLEEEGRKHRDMMGLAATIRAMSGYTD